MFAGFLLLLYVSVHRTLCADISAQILCDICNSSLCAINYLRRSLRMTSLCLACAVGRPHFYYSKGSFSCCSIDYSLLLNHSPSEWFSLYKNTPLPQRFCSRGVFLYGTICVRRRRGRRARRRKPGPHAGPNPAEKPAAVRPPRGRSRWACQHWPPRRLRWLPR